MALTTIPASGAKLRASVLSSLITEVRPTYAPCTLALTVNNSTTLQDIVGCSASVVASAVYEVRGRVTVTSNATADFALGWTLPASASIDVIYAGYGSASTLALPLLTSAGAWGMGGGNLSGTTYDTVLVDGVITVSSTAGTVQLRGAQNTATVADTIFKAGSTYLTFRRLS